MADDLSVGECILRALQASEIADSCPEPKLRQSFFDLSSTWLSRAELGAQAKRAGAGAPPSNA
jgi:hypothetical protein